MEFATKPIRHYPPHLRHVATLPWEITQATFDADIGDDTFQLYAVSLVDVYFVACMHGSAYLPHYSVQILH